MLRILAGFLVVATIVSATLAVAHPVHYAMAVAGTKQASLAVSETVDTALAGDTGAARDKALAQCREATNRDCVAIGSGAASHAHK